MGAPLRFPYRFSHGGILGDQYIVVFAWIVAVTDLCVSGGRATPPPPRINTNTHQLADIRTNSCKDDYSLVSYRSSMALAQGWVPHGKGVTKRCRLGWPTAPSDMSPNAGEREGLRGLSQWVQLYTRSPNKLRRFNSIFNLCPRTFGPGRCTNYIATQHFSDPSYSQAEEDDATWLLTFLIWVQGFQVLATFIIWVPGFRYWWLTFVMWVVGFLVLLYNVQNPLLGSRLPFNSDRFAFFATEVLV
jgi:hypothetical protein